MTAVSERLRERVGDRLGARRNRPPAGERFLERPYASVQLLLLTTAGLLGFGILMAISTTIAAADDSGTGGSIWGQGIREAEFIGIGLLVFWLAIRLSPRALRVLVYPILVLAVVALVAVLVPGIGVAANGANRWIDIGPLELQPSEFAKVAMLLWGADLLARKQQLGTLRRARHLFVPLVPGFTLVSLLVMAEPDLGTTCCFMLILLGLLWMVGMPMRYFALLVAFIGAAITVLAVTAPYRLERLTSYLDPFKHVKTSGYHTVEGLYALASGGLFGVGLGQGTSKYGWVPNANSDYVFAIVGEELGLLGCLAVLALFALLAYTGMRIVRRSADPFVRLVAGGATIWLCGQAVINIGYVSGLLPVTGIPLPLISAGGTSMLVTFFVLGALVSAARHETVAVAASRKAERRAARPRAERWCLLPTPRAYLAPKRGEDAVSPDVRSKGASRRDERSREESRRSAAKPPGRAPQARRGASDGPERSERSRRGSAFGGSKTGSAFGGSRQRAS